MMADSVPAVLGSLAQVGVSVQWRGGRAVFKAAAAPPADIVALIDTRKAEISAFLHPDAIQSRLDAEANVLRAPRPPDVADDRWETALRGLRAFLAAGHGHEAARLGWPRDELYAVPPLWSQINLCGAALLIGDREVVSLTADAIALRTPSGAVLRTYRKPQIDYALIYETRLKLIRGNYAGHSEEPRLRAVEHTVNTYRSNHPSDTVDTAKTAVLAAINRAASPICDSGRFKEPR